MQRRMKKLQLTLAAKWCWPRGTDSENQAELLDAELHRMIVQNNKMQNIIDELTQNQRNADTCR